MPGQRHCGRLSARPARAMLPGEQDREGRHAPGSRSRTCACRACAVARRFARPRRGAATALPGSTRRLLAAAKKEGSVVVYTSTNEREGLPLFKIFEDATGIKVHYIRAGDGMLVSRSLIEARAGQSSFDVIFSHCRAQAAAADAGAIRAAGGQAPHRRPRAIRTGAGTASTPTTTRRPTTPR